MFTGRIELSKHTKKQLPAPLSFTNIFSDIVIFDDLLAVLSDEYNTQSIQITRPITSKFPEDLPPNSPHKPGLHSPTKVW